MNPFPYGQRTRAKAERSILVLLLALAGCVAEAVKMDGKPPQGETVLLDESFGGATFDRRLRWLNPPPVVAVRDGWLSFSPGDETDFWQKTLDGGARDNGHFLFIELSGDFVAETKVTGEFQNQYDQAGLMLRRDATHWLKADAENDPVGTPTLGVVITRETSDWSVSRPAPKEFFFRLERRGDLVEVRTSVAGREWSLLRQATFPLQDPVQVGVFAACPVKAGLRARFDYLKIFRPSESPTTP
jgi:hypothetical protein